MSLLARPLVRHAAPLTALALVAMAPWLALAWTSPPAAGGRVAWFIAATAWIGQLWLVGAAAAIRRAPSPSLLRALRAGLRGLAQSAVPWLCAVAAIAVGGIALVLPGVVLLVLFALAPASDARGLPAPLVESAALVRRSLVPVIALVAGLVLADLAAALVAKLLVVPPMPPNAKRGAPPTPEVLAGLRHAVLITAGAVTLAAPWFAGALAGVSRRSAAAASPAARPPA